MRVLDEARCPTHKCRLADLVATDDGTVVVVVPDARVGSHNLRLRVQRNVLRALARRRGRADADEWVETAMGEVGNRLNDGPAYWRNGGRQIAAEDGAIVATWCRDCDAEVPVRVTGQALDVMP